MCVSSRAQGELQGCCRVVGRKWRDGEGYGAVRTLMCSRSAPRSDGQSRAEGRQRVGAQRVISALQKQPPPGSLGCGPSLPGCSCRGPRSGSTPGR